MYSRNFWLGLLLSNILLIWAVLPLLSNGYFPMHDDTQVSRVIGMGSALIEKQFPVRIIDDLGYGYGYLIFNYYSPLPYYFGGALYAIGLDAVTATKMMFMAPFFLGASFLYLFLYPMYGAIGAVIGSLLFSYAPYHAVQVYIRGSVGEYWAIAFVPLLLFGSFLILQKSNTYKGIVLGSVGLAATLQSHTILGIIILTYYICGIILYSVYGVCRKQNNWKIVGKAILVVCFGLGLSAYFWLPAFFEMKYTAVTTMIHNANTGFYDHFLCPFQLWNSPWGFGGSASGCFSDGMSFKLGKIQILLASVSLGILLWKKYKKSSYSHSFQIFVGVMLSTVSIVSTLSISAPFWSIFPFTSFIQYPWRLLSISMLGLAIVGGSLVTFIRTKNLRYVASIGIVATIIFINAKIFTPEYMYIPDRSSQFTKEDTLFRVSKISDEYLPNTITKPQSLNEIPRSFVRDSVFTQYKIISQTASYLNMHTKSVINDTITINKAYVPGWKFFLDAAEVKPDIIQGLPRISISKGTHILEGTFVNTPIRSQGNILSIMSVLLLGGILFYGQKTKT